MGFRKQNFLFKHPHDQTYKALFIAITQLKNCSIFNFKNFVSKLEFKKKIVQENISLSTSVLVFNTQRSPRHNLSGRDAQVPSSQSLIAT